MYFVTAYLFYICWDYFGYRVHIEVVLKHWAPQIIDSLNRLTRKLRPQQKPSLYG